MAKLFGIIPYGGSSKLGQFVKDAGTVGQGFMGQALASKSADDKRTADLEDAVTQATLSAAINLDSKYPAFKAAEETRIKKYESLKNNSAVGPEVAKWAYFQPGFLDNDNYLQNAYEHALSNPRYKHSGGVEPSEQYQENINQFQNTVRGKFGDSHGGNMSSLFVGEATQPTTPTTIDSAQTDTTNITTDLTSSTQTDTGAESDFTTSMMPPLNTSQTPAEMKASVWRKVLGGYENGMSPRDMFNKGFINEGELKIWDNTTGQDKFKAEAITTAMSIDDDYQSALNSGNSEALIQATANLQNKVNILYSLNRTLDLENNKNIPNVELNNKTYAPSTNNTLPEDGSKVIYSEGDGDDAKFYVKQGNVMLELIPDEANKKGYAIEGSPRYKELTKNSTTGGFSLGSIALGVPIK